MEKEEERRRYVLAQLNSLPNAFQYVEVTQYINDLETQLKKQKEITDKAIEYIKNKGGYCEEYDMTSKPFNTIELDDLLQILEDKEV